MRRAGFILFSICLTSLLVSIRRFPLSENHMIIGEPISLSTRLIYPSAVHFGEKAKISLKVELMDSLPGEKTTALDLFSSQSIDDTDTMSNTPIFAEARLESPKDQAFPAGSIVQTMARGHPANFSWTLQPARPGVSRGQLWVYVDAGHTDWDATTFTPVLVHDIEVNSQMFLGFPPKKVRPFLILGLLAGMLVAFLPIRHKIGSNKSGEKPKPTMSDQSDRKGHGVPGTSKDVRS